MEKNNNIARSGKSLRKPVLLATLLLTAVGLSACLVAPDRGDRGRQHHWNNDRNWNDDDSGWHGRHGNWNGQH